jgi:hypothetical protein
MMHDQNIDSLPAAVPLLNVFADAHWISTGFLAQVRRLQLVNGRPRDERSVSAPS